MFSRVPLIGCRWLQAFKPVAISVIGVGAWALFTLPLSGAETVNLPNGDYLIVDPGYDLPGSPPVPDVGAVYYHQAGTGQVLGMFTGSQANDQVGNAGITMVGSSGFLIRSPQWDNGPAADAGAVTYGNVYVGLIGGVISASNSFVGSTGGDQIGSGGITLLGGSVFLVHSPLWDNGPAVDAGAVTFGNPNVGPVAGVISASNSLVGSSAGDQIGSGFITVFGSSDAPRVLVYSPQWDNGSAVDAGAFTVAVPGAGPIAGAISASNSLVGSSTGDQIGSGGVFPITVNIGAVSTVHGFIAQSPRWDHGPAVNAGAVTVIGGLSGQMTAGLVSAANSIVGSHPGDQVGSGGFSPRSDLLGLDLLSPHWCYGAGAATPFQLIPPMQFGSWAGVVSAANSTVGAETAEPEIVLRQPSPTEVPSGSSRDFGGVAANASSSLTFTIHNSGTDDLLLNGLPKVAVTGADAALFSIVAQPRDLIVTGDSATFTVNFTPTGTGTKTAQLSISTNDSNESPYVIQLSGTVLLPISDWRQTHFGGSANSGNAADTADVDHDGVANILEYAFGLHPGQNSAGQLPLPARNGGDLTVVFHQPAHVSGVVYEAEWSTSLAPTSWLPVPDTGVPPLHVFTVPAMGNTQVFMRFKVSPSL